MLKWIHDVPVNRVDVEGAVVEVLQHSVLVVVTRRDIPHAKLVAVGFPDDLGTCITEELHGGRVERRRILCATILSSSGPANRKSATHQRAWRKHKSSEVRQYIYCPLSRRSCLEVRHRDE